MLDAGDDGESEPVRPPRSVIVGVVVVGLQAVGFVALAVIVVVKTLGGSQHSLGGALIGAALALVGAGVLSLCGRALLAERAAARTPIIVLELLALPVSYSLTFPAHRPGYGAPILVSALAVLYLLFTPSARASLDRERR